VPPQIEIRFPASGGSYTAAELDAGCPGDAGICGTAADALSGVALVEVAIQRQADGAWWNGTGFSAASEAQWLRASGTAAWHLPFPAPAPGEYAVRARAIDQDDNRASVHRAFSRVDEPRRGFLARLLSAFGWL
jgi:hypothetical protein